MPTKVDRHEDFVKIIEKHECVIIDFYADWCGPCKMFEPVFCELENTYTQCKFIKINVDFNKETTKKYEVTAMPTFVILRNKELVCKIIGANREKLVESIKEITC
jgi:thioredoxin 1